VKNRKWDLDKIDDADPAASFGGGGMRRMLRDGELNNDLTIVATAPVNTATTTTNPQEVPKHEEGRYYSAESTTPYDPDNRQFPWDFHPHRVPAVHVDSTDYNRTFNTLGGTAPQRRRLLQDPASVGRWVREGGTVLCNLSCPPMS
jgi:hypothetical protein